MSTDGGGRDPFGSGEVLKLVVQKLGSQSLLFGLACMVVLAVGYLWAGPSGMPLVVGVLVVFVVALAGYLFVEQKKKVDEKDPATMNRILAKEAAAIEHPPGEFAVRVWTTRVGGAAVGAGARDIGVSPKPPGREGERYRIGETICVHVQATKDCHVTLLNVGTSGKLTVLFPNGAHAGNRLRAGEEHRIPGDEYGFEYRLEGPPGTEILKAIATLKDVKLIESQFGADGTLFRTVGPTAGARDIAVIKKKVETEPMEEWAEGEWRFEVVA